VGLKITRNEEVVFQKEEKLRLPKTPSFKQVSSGLASGASRLRRGVSGLGGALSSSFSQAFERANELRRESSSVGASFGSFREALGSLSDFRSSFPSLNPIPKDWKNLSSGMSGVSINYGQDAKAALSLMGEAGSEARQVLGSFASRVRRSTSGLSVIAWVR
jgi:hypothetical protein